MVPTDSFNYIMEPGKPFWYKNKKYFFQNLRQLWRYHVNKFLFTQAKKRGMITCGFNPVMSGVSIETEDIEKYLHEELKEIRTLYWFSEYKVMVIYGPEIAPILRQISQPFEFNSNFKFGFNGQYAHDYYWYEIPMFFFPHISGIHIIPDLTGNWTQKMREGFQTTSFGKERRGIR
jgi:hypothetical protein